MFVVVYGKFGNRCMMHVSVYFKDVVLKVSCVSQKIKRPSFRFTAKLLL